MIKNTVLPCIALAVIMLMGCSSGRMVSPETNPVDQVSSNISRGEDNSAFLGIYQVNIDTANMTGSVEPIRASNSTDVLETVDLTGFLTSVPCRDCVTILELGLTVENHVRMAMGIKHPFPAGDISKPPTGRNRLDLHVFNVEGIILSDSPKIFRFSSVGVNLSTGYMVNADGYTTYLDSLIDYIYPTQSSAHPYKLFFNDYSFGNFSASNPNGFTDLLNPTGNLVMKMGSIYSVNDYEFLIPTGKKLSFGFAVGCTYGVSANNYLERLNPVYRCPQFNKKAASQVSAYIVNNNLEQANDASSATFHVEVMDINHSATKGTNLDQITNNSKVKSVSIHIPGVTDTVASNPLPLAGDGRFSPLVYEVTVKDDYGLTKGYLPCLIKITDSYPVGQNPNPGLENVDAMGRAQDGVNLQPITLQEFATYQYLEVYVIPCQGVHLRVGVSALDVGIDKQGHSYVLYSDRQVWRYDVGYCEGEFLYTADLGTVDEPLKIVAQDDGRSMVIGAECPT